MEILYYFKPLDAKNYNNQVDYFLFLLAVSSKYNFFDLFLIVNIFYVKFTIKEYFLNFSLTPSTPLSLR